MGVSETWFNRGGFTQSRKLLLIQWLVCVNFLLMGYKSLLLSSLVTISYEDTIDTLEDLDKSGLALLLPEGLGLVDLFENDPRPIAKRIFGQSIMVPYDGGTPEWAWERQINI